MTTPESATIFIPDISGYTDFVSTTEIEHSSHILNELLELLVASNRAGFTLSEIEGDAVLFYRKGEPLGIGELEKQCIGMFETFHTTLKMIERDTLCQCGACQSASNLTLKFIVHYGTIKEIKIASFTKASGLDMIIAHRLLKNSIASPEYILATQSYFRKLGDRTRSGDLSWVTSSYEYPSIGRLEFQYALLNTVRQRIPTLPSSEHPSYTLGEEIIEIDIHAPLEKVYDAMVNLTARPLWVPGVKSGHGEKEVDRLGTKHRCVFDGGTVEITPRAREKHESEIRYIEENTIVGVGLRTFSEFRLKRLDEMKTRLEFRIGVAEGETLPTEIMEQLLGNYRTASESFKMYCER
jgi:hypothetical protein